MVFIFNKMDSDCDDNLFVEEFIEGVKKDFFIVKLLNFDWGSRIGVISYLGSYINEKFVF